MGWRSRLRQDWKPIGLGQSLEKKCRRLLDSQILQESHHLCVPTILSFFFDTISPDWDTLFSSPVLIIVGVYSVTKSCPTLCHPIGLQHTRLPCPLPSPRVCSNSYPSSQWCHPTISSSVTPFSSCLRSFRVISNESALCNRWPKYWHFSFSISPCNEYSGLTSFRIDWFDLLAVQGILKSPLLLMPINLTSSRMYAHSVVSNYLQTPWTVACQAPLSSSFCQIFLARILEWVVISCSTGSSWSRNQTHISCVSCNDTPNLYHWATWESPTWQEYWSGLPFPVPWDLLIQESNSHLLCLLQWYTKSLPLSHLRIPNTSSEKHFPKH